MENSVCWLPGERDAGLDCDWPLANGLFGHTLKNRNVISPKKNRRVVRGFESFWNRPLS